MNYMHEFSLFTLPPTARELSHHWLTLLSLEKKILLFFLISMLLNSPLASIPPSSIHCLTQLQEWAGLGDSVLRLQRRSKDLVGITVIKLIFIGNKGPKLLLIFLIYMQEIGFYLGILKLSVGKKKKSIMNSWHQRDTYRIKFIIKMETLSS